jgi:hypothetical protein
MQKDVKDGVKDALSENENLKPQNKGEQRTKGKTAMTPTRDKALSREEPRPDDC